MSAHTIFFTGKPGSGKGTQSKLLAQTTLWPIFGAGSKFREIAGQDSAVARKVKSTIDSGVLVPYWFPMYLYLQSLFTIPEAGSAIFDGFNRRVGEAELIIESMNWFERPFTVFYLNVSDDEIRKRLALRRTTENRADDHIIEKRIQEYNEHTAATIELFKAAGVLVEINGEQTPEAIADNIRTALKI